MSKVLFRCVGFFFFTCVADSVLFASEVSIDSWDIGSVITGSGIGSDADGTGAVENPFHRVDHAELPSPGGATSTADAEYFASWDSEGFFSFLVNGQHTAAGNPQMLVTRSSGTIYITPSLNSILSIDILYDYSLGSGMREARVKGAVADSEGLVYNAEVIRNTLSSPSAGQITVDSPPIPLNAGTQYALVYLLRLMSFSGSASSLSQGEGFIRLELVPIPEPHTLALLALAGPLLLRKSHRSC